MLKQFRLLSALFTCSTALAASAGAQLIDPTGGIVDPSLGPAAYLNSTSTALGFAFNFYGAPMPFLLLTSSGSIGNTGFPAAAPNMVQSINPLHDLFLLDGVSGGVIEKGNASYYSATWNLARHNLDDLGTGPTSTFQVALFGAAMSIGSFNFLPDDIAFSYVNVDAPSNFGVFGVGLNTGDGTGHTSIPGDPGDDGLITDDAAGKALLPLYPVSSEFILFRPDGASGYKSSIETTAGPSAVPEGSSVLMMLGGLLVPGVAVLRRRRKA